MAGPENNSGLYDRYADQRIASKVDRDPSLAAWVNSEALESPWVYSGTEGVPPEVAEAVDKLSKMGAKLEEQDG